MILSVFWISFTSCGQNQPKKDSDASIELISAEDLSKLNSDILLVDVRTPQEFASGHLENAINIDFKSDHFKEEIGKLDRDKEVYVYCRSGGRSAGSAKVMQGMGFKKIYDLKGGILQWQKEDFKVVK